MTVVLQLPHHWVPSFSSCKPSALFSSECARFKLDNEVVSDFSSVDRKRSRRTIIAVMLSHPVPSPLVSGARHSSNNYENTNYPTVAFSNTNFPLTSLQICDRQSFFSRRARTKSTTSWFVLEFQMPSQARTKNSSPCSRSIV